MTDTRSPATHSIFTCPRCHRSTVALTSSTVSHRCPMVRGNAMTEWKKEGE